jgi:hypothetical protein
MPWNEESQRLLTTGEIAEFLQVRAAEIHGTCPGYVKDLLVLNEMEFEAIQAPW